MARGLKRWSLGCPVVVLVLAACGTHDPAPADGSDGANAGTNSAQGRSGAGGTGAGGASAGHDAVMTGAGHTGGEAGSGAGGSAGSMQQPAGAGGVAGSQQVMQPGTCMDSDIPTTFPMDYAAPSQYARKGTITSSSGTFEDHCEGGKLIEQVCETRLGCNAPPGADCAPREMPTGNVTTQEVACFGMCMEGACVVPCPEVGDSFTITAGPNGVGYELVGAHGLSYDCLRDDSCAPVPNQPLTVTKGVPDPAPAQGPKSCLMSFAAQPFPLQLSDGCSYYNCSTRMQ